MNTVKMPLREQYGCPFGGTEGGPSSWTRRRYLYPDEALSVVEDAFARNPGGTFSPEYGMMMGFNPQRGSSR